AARGLQLGIKTRTWQGAATGAVGGAILGGVAYAATCWW
ncbi:TPA: bacteriocin-like peptide BlpU, partial [Streptococcus pneumoniae]